MTRDLRKILKLMEKKYGKTMNTIIIYDDETGRICTDALRPYESGILSFDSIDNLVKQLQEEE